MKNYYKKQKMIAKLKKYGSTKEEIRKNLREIVQGSREMRAEYYAYLERERKGIQGLGDLFDKAGYKVRKEDFRVTIEELDKEYLGIFE